MRLRGLTAAALAIIVLVGLAVFSACIGRFAVQPAQVLHALAASLGLVAQADTPQAHMVHSVVFGARLPRIGGAICVGAALSVAGAAYQAVFRNPLVSPGLLGVLAALTVSVAGMIGWVGLVVPHVARLLVGPCNMRVLPTSACLGGMFLLVCDDLARTLSVEEIPVGLIADLLGVALFVAVLPLLRRGWRA